jgi:predicted lipid-binding transport protein (Tim44 family)
MSSEVIWIVILAVVAAAVLFQLYNVLGRRVGRQPEDVVAVPPRSPELEAKPRAQPELEAAGVAALKAREPAFDAARFLEGARQAYETVVKAFSAGDRAVLKPLLSPAVASSFDSAIATREAEGRSQVTELLHPPRADLDRVEVEGDTARARVRFLAELRTRSKGPEGEAVDDRRTAEFWTFERRIGASDPNWTLARVEAAEA